MATMADLSMHSEAWAYCKNGDYKNLDRLLETNKSLVDRKSANGQTMLMIAAQNNLPGAVDVLLRHGADVDVRDSDRMTALMMAVKCIDDVSCVTEVIRRSKDVDAVDTRGNDALFYAAEKGSLPSITALFARNADPLKDPCRLITPLDAAARNGHTHVINELMDKTPFEDGSIDNAIDTARNNGYVDTLVAILLHKSCGYRQWPSAFINIPHDMLRAVMKKLDGRCATAGVVVDEGVVVAIRTCQALFDASEHAVSTLTEVAQATGWRAAALAIPPDERKEAENKAKKFSEQAAALASACESRTGVAARRARAAAMISRGEDLPLQQGEDHSGGSWSPSDTTIAAVEQAGVLLGRIQGLPLPSPPTDSSVDPSN